MMGQFSRTRRFVTWNHVAEFHPGGRFTEVMLDGKFLRAVPNRAVPHSAAMLFWLMDNVQKTKWRLD